MRRVPASAVLCPVVVGIMLSGCAATATKTESTNGSAAPSSSLEVPKLPSGPHKTIADYVTENKIAEVPIKQGDPNAPKVSFPLPPDWRPAGNQKPEWAYGAVVYKKAENPADPPFMTAVYNKLSGDVDPAKILEYAPGLLQNLPGYQQDGDVRKTTLSGFDAIVFQGSYLGEDNEKRYVAQKTVVIPGKDNSVFVLQLNAIAPDGQGDIIREAAKVIDSDTKITQ